jgi:hypothetical protein
MFSALFASLALTFRRRAALQFEILALPRAFACKGT